MKPIYVLLLLASIASSSPLSAQNNSFCKIGELGNHPNRSNISQLEINSNNKDELQLFHREASDLTAVKDLRIIGPVDPEQWKSLADDLKKTGRIRYLELAGQDFKIVPLDIKELFLLDSLCIAGNSRFEPDVLIAVLDQLPNLHYLHLDIYSLEDIPEPNSLMNLKQLEYFFKPEHPENEDNKSKNTSYDFQWQEGNNKTAIKFITASTPLDQEEYESLVELFNNQDSTISFFNPQRNTPNFNFVKPPIPGIDVKRDYYPINNNIENLIYTPSGTVMRIPANCFTDSAGNPISGNIEISFREFRDPIDILVSGIPMKYDSAGNVQHFRSAGMFEIEAQQNNQFLQLSKGKTIDMNFVQTTNDSIYNFYAFNDSTGNWKYREKPAQVVPKTKITPVVYSPAYQNFQFARQNNKKVLDKTPFQERWNDLSYQYLIRKDSLKKNGPFVNVYYKGKPQTKSTNNLVKVNRIHKTKEGEVIFKIRTNSQTHPEMQEASNYYFELSDPITVAEFRQTFSRKTGFNDIRMQNDGTEVEITLKGKQFRTLHAKIVYLDSHGKVHDLKTQRYVLRRYQRQLKHREIAYNKDLKKGRAKYNSTIDITNPKDLDLMAYEKIKNSMSETEKKMKPEEWFNYYNNVIANEKNALLNSAVTANNLVASLSLDGMGIYNCDQIQRINEPVEIFASYNDQTGNPFYPMASYVIDKKINGVLQYDGYRGYSPNNIAFSKSKNAQNTLITVNKDGSIAVFTTEKFENKIFTNKQKFNFEMQSIGMEVKDIASLKKLIGM